MRCALSIDVVCGVVGPAASDGTTLLTRENVARVFAREAPQQLLYVEVESGGSKRESPACAAVSEPRVCG